MTRTRHLIAQSLWAMAFATCLGLTAQAQHQVTSAQPQRVELSKALLPDARSAAWRDFLQLAWNGKSNEIERVRLRFFDPLAATALSVNWKTEATVVPSGVLTGAGRIEWRATDALGFGETGLVATFDGALTDGMFSGRGRYWHRSGTVYEGGWAGGLMQGEGYLHLGDGRSYRGGFAEGAFDGTGVLIATDGSRFEGRFKAGVRHGPGIETMTDGMRFASVWEQGEEDLTRREVLIRPEDITPTLAQQLAYSDLSFGVTADQRKNSGAHPYVGQNQGNTLVAFPGDPDFMQAWRSGGAILRAEDAFETEGFAPANLLMTLENRGAAPLQVVGGYLAVQSSTPDMDPYIVFDTPYDCGQPALTEVSLSNSGWSEPLNASIEGGFVSGDGKRYLLGVNVPSLQGWPNAQFDLIQALMSSGPELASLATYGLNCPQGNREQCGQAAIAQGLFGSLADGVYFQGARIMADYYGIISYSWRDHTGQSHQKRSSLRVPIKIGRFVEQNECGEGDGYGSPFPNPFVLPINQANYRFPFTLFATLQPGTVQNWNFQIDAAQASRHIFSVVLQLSDGREVASRLVDLTYFKAKSPWQVQ